MADWIGTILAILALLLIVALFAYILYNREQAQNTGFYSVRVLETSSSDNPTISGNTLFIWNFSGSATGPQPTLILGSDNVSSGQSVIINNNGPRGLSVEPGQNSQFRYNQVSGTGPNYLVPSGQTLSLITSSQNTYYPIYLN